MIGYKPPQAPILPKKNYGLTEDSFRPYFDSISQMRSEFYASHNIQAAMACEKLWHDASLSFDELTLYII